ncbi:hypothetical protein BCR33DRAFT_738308 [Rhizoclosmatium globosum]|uniref:L domain-like protein n=1 Tax=Rhizoclosmatium globosum TaxID=329046 RepID=A0A1Y2CCW4_9FUNG|nr:hypothetical protein BCR33DRAFT_738308 [Rhizoclosmatium globosum]|eukprot:ORY44155.1 hypothetical protein BCR33DRAFT_738308 [Rhizoclosmatium globosum]
MSDCDILSSVYPSVLNGQDCCKLAGVICEQLGKRVITSLTFVGYGSFIGGQNPGSIPTQIGLLTALTLLDIRNTNFTGTIPTEIGNLGQLKSLRISSNALSSVEGYPREATAKFGEFLGYNALSGPIPREIGNLTKLNYLSLGNNVLSGPIPSEIGYLTGLNVLNLSNNNLSGVVPDELYSLALKPSLDTIKNRRSFRKLLTDFNITLFFMMVSLFLMISIEVGVALNDVLKIDTAQNAVLYFLIACFELSYIKYSFARSNDVLEAIFPPIIHKALRGFGLVSPLVLFPQVIPPAMMASAVTSSPSMIAAYNILPSVAGICTVLQDIYQANIRGAGRSQIRHYLQMRNHIVNVLCIHLFGYVSWDRQHGFCRITMQTKDSYRVWTSIRNYFSFVCNENPACTEYEEGIAKIDGKDPSNQLHEHWRHKLFWKYSGIVARSVKE